ncbi:hypothetical protein NN3_05700 [Nocardia neocaledoniensis NBRC 108232]|nr:hypothetical protein NN3_05700 [Nocardia neocaledoniensis NBRC 108232]
MNAAEVLAPEVANGTLTDIEGGAPHHCRSHADARCSHGRGVCRVLDQADLGDVRGVALAWEGSFLGTVLPCYGSPQRRSFGRSQ